MLLPELSTYFNISVDELLGYSPQLTKEDIKKIYNNLSHEFAVNPFDEVMEQCNKLIKKYYSCFPFLLSIIQLLLNYSNLINQKKEKAIDALERYVNTVCSIQFPLSFKENKYFTHVGKWIEHNNFIGTNAPLDEITIKKSFVDTVARNPAFEPLREDDRYNLLVKKLKEKLGEKWEKRNIKP